MRGVRNNRLRERWRTFRDCADRHAAHPGIVTIRQENAVHTATKIALAAVIIAGMSCAAMARYASSIPGDKVLAGAATGSRAAAPISTDISAQRERVRQNQNSRHTYAPMQSRQVSGGVGADNYQYWRQACCQ